MMDGNTQRHFRKHTDRGPINPALHKSLASIRHTFLVMSSQGGVGKTSVIVNLAVALSKRNMRVGLLDVNFHGPGVHRMLGLKPAIAPQAGKNILPLSYSDYLKVASVESLIEAEEEAGFWGNPMQVSDLQSFISRLHFGSLDYLLIDTTPGPSEELLFLLYAIPNPKIIIVTAPQKILEYRAEEMIHFLRSENLSVFGWIENMRGFLCQNCGQLKEQFSTGSGARAAFLMDVPFLGRIPVDPKLSGGSDIRKPFLEAYPDSQASEAYELIAEKILEGSKDALPEGRSDS